MAYRPRGVCLNLGAAEGSAFLAQAGVWLAGGESRLTEGQRGHTDRREGQRKHGGSMLDRYEFLWA